MYMKKATRFIITIIAAATTTGCNNISEEFTRISPSTNVGKFIENNNPISPVVFCADPTGVEYEGRLYIYGTNDHQQYFNAKENGYEKIKSLVCFSTEDMVNWTYHGIIDIEEKSPWIVNSWAPSIVSRVEEDGKTHFYLYYSNSGCGVGIITATHPLGPWKDAKGSPLVYQGMPEIGDCPNPFDPGVCIDEHGVAYVAFGAGTAKDGTAEMPGVSRIARLNSDMISCDTIIEVHTPYIFEAHEINYFNGVYLYTYNNNWQPRNKETWNYPGYEVPMICSMAYMTSKTPMDTDSWEYKGDYFPNPGDLGMRHSNNHTHFMKYKGEYYILYHTLNLQDNLKVSGGFRSMAVEKFNFDEDKIEIQMTRGTHRGVNAIEPFNPFNTTSGTTMSHGADIWFENDEQPDSITVYSKNRGAWIGLTNVDFGKKASSIITTVEGNGHIEVRTGSIDGETIAYIESSEEQQNIRTRLTDKISGTDKLFFVFSDENIKLIDWRFK